MKKMKFKIVFIIFASFLVACSEHENVVYDSINGQTALQFDETSLNFSVPEEGTSIEVPVISTKAFDSEKTFNVSVNGDNTTAADSEYSIGNIVFPADSYEGILTFKVNYDDILGVDGETKDVEINIDSSSDIASYNDILQITFFRAIICNDVLVEITSDVYGAETSFEITDAEGNEVVPEFFPFGFNSTQPQEFSQTFTLPDGDYIFTLYDSYGDGQVGTGGGVTLTGNYSVTCSIIVHAQGEGELENGSFESTAFTVNP
jgi:hypothetical protein